MSQKLIYVPYEKYGYGSCDLVLVGEAPGAAEEKQLRPFCGKSGQFLRRALEDNLDIGLYSYAMTNVLKVRPEDNRTPTKKEIKSWLPLLKKELQEFMLTDQHWSVVNIVAVGKVAKKALDLLEVEYYYIHHPAWVMRNRTKMKEWEKQIRKIGHG